AAPLVVHIVSYPQIHAFHTFDRCIRCGSCFARVTRAPRMQSGERREHPAGDDAVAEARQARQPGLERNRSGMIPDTRAVLGRRRWAVRDRLSGGLSPVGLGAPRAEPGPRRGGVGAGTPASSFPRVPTSEVYIM